MFVSGRGEVTRTCAKPSRSWAKFLIQGRHRTWLGGPARLRQSGNARIYHPNCKVGLLLGMNGVRGPSYNPTRVLTSCIRNLKLCTTSHITRSMLFVFHMSDDYPLFNTTPIQPQPTLLKFKIAPWKFTFPIQPSFCRGDMLNFGEEIPTIFFWGGVVGYT